MAITKCLHMKQAKTGYPAKHLANGLRYIMNPEKTEHGRYVCGHNCIPEQALSQMVDTKRHFGKLDKRQGYHFILSFEEDEVSEEEAFQVVGEFVTEFLGKDFEAVYAVHNDTDHIHGHIILIQYAVLRDINTIIKRGLGKHHSASDQPDMQGAWFICAGSGRSKGKTQTKRTGRKISC